MEELIADIVNTYGPYLVAAGTSLVTSVKESAEESVLSGVQKKVKELFSKIAGLVSGDRHASSVVGSYMEAPKEAKNKKRLKTELETLFEEQPTLMKELEPLVAAIKADLENVSGASVSYATQEVGSVGAGATVVQLQGGGNTLSL